MENDESWLISSESTLSAASGAPFAPRTVGAAILRSDSASSIVSASIRRKGKSAVVHSKSERLAHIQASEADIEIRLFKEGRL